MQETIQQILEQKFRSAFIAVGIDSNVPVILQESGRPEFGDYQINGAMAAAKQLKQNPRELAQKIIDNVKLDSVIEKLELAGPGFINIYLADRFLAGRLGDKMLDVSLAKPETIVVDYSAPNLAKEMHVGHLRSTVIGDCLVRVYEYMGNKVIRRNHVGDWGTQFGMLIAYLQEQFVNPEFDRKISDLEVFYREAKLRFDNDPDFANLARQYVVILQNYNKINKGDFNFIGADLLDFKMMSNLKNGTLALDVRSYWGAFFDASMNSCDIIYSKLGVKLTRNDVWGESRYNDLLAPMVDKLMKEGIAVDSNGAKCVFFTEDELGSKDETPFIIQKSDGGYLYATTDIAAVYDRVNNLHATRLVYVIDSRQSLHLKQLFVVAYKSHIADSNIKMEHAAFGTMMGEDGKPFKTRTGGTIKLIDLINEAITRATALVKDRNPEWTDDEVASLGQILGVAAMKYADLSKNRTTDYIFSFDKMLAFEGNTAPYLLYAYTRVNSIFLKAQSTIADYLNKDVMITNEDEHRLALHIARFPDRLIQVARENYPHYLCSYIYELAVLFMKFYESSPILKEIDLTLRESRLALAANTGKTLEVTLNLLGIPVVAKM